VLPAIEQASDDVQLSSAIGQFIMWKTTTRLALGVEFFTGFDDVAETAQAHDALVIKLRQAIDRNNVRCAQDESLAALANVLFWQSQATRFGLVGWPPSRPRDHPAGLAARTQSWTI
jgi:hypothetical protein